MSLARPHPLGGRRALAVTALLMTVVGAGLLYRSKYFGGDPESPLPGKTAQRSTGQQPAEGAFAVPARQGQAWALVLAPRPLRAGDSAKIVVRVTGSGRLRAWATGPGDLQVASSPPPSAHLSSTFRRPGDEFGTYFLFPSNGSWTVSLERSGLQAAFQLQVGTG